MTDFKLDAAYNPTADQPSAIESLRDGIEGDERFLTLLGATGTGKTMTMAGAIDQARAAGERILVRSWVAGRSDAFGDVSQRQAQVLEFRDGRILRITQTEDPPPGWEEARPLT